MIHEITIPKQFIECGDDIRYIRLRTGKTDPEDLKRAIDKKWTHGEGGRKHDDKYLLEWIGQGNNYGYHVVSGNICIFDCDDPLYDPAFTALFENTFTVKTGRGYHFVFKSDLTCEKEKITLDTSTDTHIGHILLPGMKFQTVGPGCVHPSGGRYTIIKDLPFAWVPASEIKAHINRYVKKNDETYSKIPHNTNATKRSPLCEALDLRVEDIGYPDGNIRQHGLEIQGVHPFHGSSRGNKGDNYSINPTKGLWHCFRHGKGGDALTLMAVKHGIISCGEAEPGCLDDEHRLSRLLDLIRHGVEGSDLQNRLIEYETRERDEYFKKKEDALPKVILDGIINPKPKVQEVVNDTHIPKELLSIPGVLQEAVNYFNATAIKPQPQIAVLAAIALSSVILGRRYFTTMDNGANMYLGVVAKSSSGKEHIKTVIEKILAACDSTKLIGPQGYTSAGAVATWLYKKPNHICMMDEFGRMLQSLNKSGNSNQMDAITELMQVYGRQTGIYIPRGYSEIAQIKRNKHNEESVNLEVHHPSITVLGITTPTTLYAGLNSDDVSSGFLPRFVMVDSVYGRQISKRRGVSAVEVPGSLVDWCNDKVRATAGDGNLACVDAPAIPPEPIIIQISEEAYILFEEYEAECHKYQDANEAAGLDVMWGRCRENAQRLALNVAVSCESDTILASHAAWAISFVKFYSERLIKEAGGRISDTDFEAAVKSVYLQIERAGARGIVPSEISRNNRKYKGLNTTARSSVLNAIVDDYDVVAVAPPAGKRGKKSCTYILSKYVQLDE